MRYLLFACLCFLPTISFGATKAQINKAIDKGAEFIQGQQKGNGHLGNHNLGSTALATLALIESGVKVDDPVVAKALDVIRQSADQTTHTYTLSLMIMLLDRVGDRQDSKLIKSMGERLVAGQSQSGIWNYSVPLKVTINSQRQIQRGNRGGDHSNTQFAVLGCWVARRHGADVDAALQRAAQSFRKQVDPNRGGWGYRGRSGSTPSMTCAGLISLAVGHGTQTAKLRAATKLNGKGVGGKGAAKLEDDEVVQKAMKYISDHIGRGPDRNLYFLWSLERVAVIYGLKSFGETDWYEYGTEILLANQRPDGQFTGGSGPVESTSFALLFLNRSNVAKDLTAIVGGKSTLSSGESVEDLKRLALNRSVDQKTQDVTKRIADEKDADTQRELIQQLRDAKGVANSLALSQSIYQLDGEIQEVAREALADRFVRMTARTLKGKLSDQDRETRLAAVKAARKKKAAELIPELIDLLIDKDLTIARESHKSLVELSGQNFGPAANAKLIDFFVAKKSWQKWWESRN